MNVFRVIPFNARHPDDLVPTYLGDSVGHWEGDTLVVDTVSLDDTTWLGGPGASLHSDKEHVIERWTRKGNQVTVETTVEDPSIRYIAIARKCLDDALGYRASLGDIGLSEERQ